MKKYRFLVLAGLLAGFATSAMAQHQPAPGAAAPVRRQARPARPQVTPPTYYMVLLRAAKVSESDIEALATVRAAHMAYLQQLRQEGKLALAGSCPGADQSLQSMYLLKVADLPAAQALSAADPCVQLGRLTAEVYPWVGQGSAKL
ncbi:YciI family protein [Hymenobacter algoricola]|uniref:YCII-related domain-containing protein n=1 Tax=Hymenobacter algoricola TaxID=486267 RepID=A0ABP7MDG2_9BACT